MGLKKKTVAQIEAELELIDRDRALLKERGAQLMRERARKILDDQLDEWGLTEAQYAAAKHRARTSGTPAHVCLNEARKAAFQEAKEALTAKADVSSVGVKVKGT